METMVVHVENNMLNWGNCMIVVVLSIDDMSCKSVMIVVNWLGKDYLVMSWVVWLMGSIVSSYLVSVIWVGSIVVCIVLCILWMSSVVILVVLDMLRWMVEIVMSAVIVMIVVLITIAFMVSIMEIFWCK